MSSSHSHSLSLPSFASSPQRIKGFVSFHEMDQERKKRIRSDQGSDQLENKIKHAKRQDQQNDTTIDLGSTSYSSQDGHDDDHHHRRRGGDDSDVAALGVFDFPWLKDGGGVSRPDEWKLEDSFVSQLGESSNISTTTIVTPAGFEFSFPGHCSFPRADPTLEFFPDKFDEDDHQLCPSPPLEDIGFETAESLDCIWSAFA